MADKNALEDAAYQIADDFRSDKWPQFVDDPSGSWEFLLGLLREQCPGFTDEEYRSALDHGFVSSR